MTPSYDDDLVLVTGMTGAGRSTAAKALEDLGWFVIDNLPPQLLPTVVKLVREDHDDPGRTAVVVDVRTRGFFTELRGALDMLAEGGMRPSILYVEASDEVLVRRQEAARRPHPLQEDGRLLDGIRRERVLMRDLRGDADVIIDTSDLNVHELETKVATAFAAVDQLAVRATVISFGFKYGIPVDADMVLDTRFLPNPHWVDSLRDQTGLDRPVQDYVFEDPSAEQFLSNLDGLLSTVAPGFVEAHKRYLTLAIGCTGGKHRSVVMAEAIGAQLRNRDVEALVVHRDLGRE